MVEAGADLDARLARARDALRRLRGEIAKVIVGHAEVVEETLIALLAGGHALLEGVPGIGKTLLVRTLARCLSLRFSRIQFTPDLMPADVTGTNLLAETPGGGREWRFAPGPIFTHLLLADEINRATPKTQSALLEAMQERAVTVAGTRREIDEPFFVLATQNPIEMEGTYPLPEAQLDRFFFKVRVRPPPASAMLEIIERTTGPREPEAETVLDAAQVLDLRALVREVPIPRAAAEYAARLVEASHPDGAKPAAIARRYVRHGASPRAAQALVLGAKARALLADRTHAAEEDVREIARPALRHRLILNYAADADKIDADAVAARLLEEA